jgi:hypothetical protein
MEDMRKNCSEHVEAFKLSSTKNANPDVDAELQAFAIDFAQRDAEWYAYKTKHLLRKIDIHLLPWIVLMCMFQTSNSRISRQSLTLEARSYQFPRPNCARSGQSRVSGERPPSPWN